MPLLNVTNTINEVGVFCTVELNRHLFADI